MSDLAAAFLAKGDEFSPFIKMGRTQLQDAVPMTLGQEFTAFGHTMLEDVQRLGEAQALIREINMGATAIGTGITAPAGYAEAVRSHLSRITKLELITAPDLVEATADTGAFVQLSGVLKRCAVKLSKICNDLRLLASGPRAGLGEIDLPAMQPGSSIMPGKVNPVIPEVVNQVCFDVIGADLTVTIAAEAGQLQLNVFEPVIAFRLLAGIYALTNACVVLRERCVEGISANPDRHAPVRRAVRRHRHRARAGARLRDGHRDRARSAGERPRSLRARAVARAHDARGARPRAQPRDDDAAAVHFRGARRAIDLTRDGCATTQADRPGAVRAPRRSDQSRLLQRRLLQQRPRRAARRRARGTRDLAAVGEARRAGSAGSTKRSRCSSCAATTSPRSRCTRCTRATGSSPGTP